MAVVTTNLVTQIQNRIDNLNGSETLEQLLILRKAADNLDLDLTDIETAISAKIAAFDSGTADQELLIANRAASLVPKPQGDIRYKLMDIVSGIVPLGTTGVVLAAARPNNRSKLIIKYLVGQNTYAYIDLTIDGVTLAPRVLGQDSLGLNAANFYIMEHAPGNISQALIYKGISSPIECNSFSLSKESSSLGISYKYEVWEQHDEQL